MRRFILILVLVGSLSVAAQEAGGAFSVNNPMDIKGTSYVLLNVTSRTKEASFQTRLLFRDTATGESRTLDLPEGFTLRKAEQVKMDNLGINKIVLLVNSPLHEIKSGTNYIYIVSPDGTTVDRVEVADGMLVGFVANEATGRAVFVVSSALSKTTKADAKGSPLVTVDLKTGKKI